VFREIMLKIYQEKLVGPAPPFPVDMEKSIDAYLSGDLPGKEQTPPPNSEAVGGHAENATDGCRGATNFLPTNPCPPPGNSAHLIYHTKDERGHGVFTND